MHGERIMFESGTTSNYLAVLTPTLKACQRVCLWRLLLMPIGKLKCYISTDEQIGRRCRAESGSNHLYEWPGYKNTLTVPAYFFLPPHTETKSQDCHLSVDIRSALAIQEATVCISDSLTAKIEIWKFQKPGFVPVSQKNFAPTKITNHMAFFNVLRVVFMCTCIPTHSPWTTVPVQWQLRQHWWWPTC